MSCGDVAGKPVFEHRDDLFVSRSEHRFVFFSRESAARVFILAVLHEKMDLMARLRDRLDAGGLE
ncbi:MAG: plasmid stabilization system protein ParE [Neolewinella sp.]